MAHGLKIWDASGNLITDENSRFTRYESHVIIPGSGATTGTITIASSQGTIWYHIVQIETSIPAPASEDYLISIAGNVLTWTRRGPHPAVIFYGVY